MYIPFKNLLFAFLSNKVKMQYILLYHDRQKYSSYRAAKAIICALIFKKHCTKCLQLFCKLTEF